LAEEINGELGLREEEIPAMFGERWINTGEDGEEVGFECADCTFGFVAAVHVRWDELMLAVPFLGDAVDVGSAGFIVEDLFVNFETTCF
jgi:hypothetical protein